jgi:hypothetical protein
LAQSVASDFTGNTRFQESLPLYINPLIINSATSSAYHPHQYPTQHWVDGHKLGQAHKPVPEPELEQDNNCNHTQVVHNTVDHKSAHTLRGGDVHNDDVHNNDHRQL